MFDWMTRSRLIYSIHLVFLSMVLLPFLFFGDDIHALSQSYLSTASRYEVAGVVIGLLGLDVFLPVPSSVVATASGLLLGWELGFFSNFTGLTLGGVLGYAVGNVFRRTFFRRYYDDNEFRQVSYDLANYGFFILIALRGVPVLAEMSALAAGFHRYPFRRFLLALLISNSFLAAVGTYLGIEAADSGSLSVIVVAFLTVPVIGYSIRIYWLSRNGITSSDR